jgi:hypothetical protein
MISAILPVFILSSSDGFKEPKIKGSKNRALAKDELPLWQSRYHGPKALGR